MLCLPWHLMVLIESAQHMGRTLDYKFILATTGLPQGESAGKVAILFILG